MPKLDPKFIAGFEVAEHLHMTFKCARRWRLSGVVRNFES